MSGIIYAIKCNVTGEQYIGSTTTGLNQRISSHKSNFKAFELGKRKSLCSAYDILKRNQFNSHILEVVPYGDDKSLLKERETFHIKQNICVNLLNASFDKLAYNKDYFSTDKGKQVKQESDRKYREKNREELLEKKRAYHHANKEAIALKAKAYRKANQEKIKEQKRLAYQRKKEREKENNCLY